MNVLLLGASGGCGRWALELAASRGYSVTALVRSAAEVPKVKGGEVEILRGPILDGGLLAALIPRANAVICCLGMKRRHPINPWSELVSPPRFMEQVARRIVESARGLPLRVAAISAAGVAESAPALPGLMRFLIARSNVGVAYRDLAEMERTFAASELAWEAVRPVTLFDGSPSGRIKIVDRFRMTSRISRGDVAQWLVDAIGRPPDLLQRTPMVAQG